jgi:hypothetical protein
MVVRPEIVLRANPALERIVNEAGESLLYRA